jgi:hypothetical protein
LTVLLIIEERKKEREKEREKRVKFIWEGAG